MGDITRNSCNVSTLNPMVVQSTVTNATTTNTQDGSIQININGGTSPYTIVWSNGQQGYVLNNLSPGTYTVTVTDYYGDYQETLNITVGFNLPYLDEFIKCNSSLNSDIFVFYDGTSLNTQKAKTASESVRSWYQNKFNNGFGGLLYEGVIGSVENNGEKIWAAGPTTTLQPGDMIAFDTGMPMKNFHSKSMKRDFPILYFVDRFDTDKIKTETNEPASTEPHGQIAQQQAEPVKGIKKLDDGQTIAEVIAHKKSLVDKNLRIRGKVTKFTPEVLGKNWIHIRDSSTLEDLTVTTDGSFKIDDIVIVEGKLGLNKDFGYGYVYPVIIENAKVSKE